MTALADGQVPTLRPRNVGLAGKRSRITREDAMSSHRQELGDVSEEKAHAA